MPLRIITQPLPQDLRNWSFKGINCEGWDFSGRDIRGCDFRNANLNNVDFSKVIAGRSQKQQVTGILIIVAVAVAVAGLRAIKSFSEGRTLEGIVFSAVAIVCLLFSIYSTREAIREFKNATGTNFRGTDLKNADFSQAKLDNCNFDQAKTAYVNWTHVEGKRSTIDFTYVRIQLLASRKGSSSIYADLDLSERDLNGIELIKANLSRADVTRSNLRSADLTLANLTNLKAGDADFTDATLTGACIQNWTINSGTQFDRVLCEHIFLTPDRNPQNRRPLSGSFEPGDFALLVDKFADSLDFILRRGTNPIAFKQALNQFQQENPEARIKAMMGLDVDRVLVQSTLPEGSDKVRAYEAFQVTLKLREQEIRHLKGTIDEKDERISMMDRWFQASQRPTQILNQPTGDLMPDNRTQTQAGGDINIATGKSAISTGSSVAAAGNISGTLNLNLNTLSKTEDPKAKELVALINQVKEAIEAPDSELDDRHKTRALEYLSKLTELAKDKPEDFLKHAKDNLDDLSDIAEKGSKLAIFAAKYLPTFTAAIAGLRLWFGI